MRRVVTTSGDVVFAPGAEGQVSRLVRLHLCSRRVAGPAAGRRRPGLLCFFVVAHLLVVGGNWRRQGVSAVREWLLIRALGRRCGIAVGSCWRAQGVSAIREWFLIHTLGCRCGT